MHGSSFVRALRAAALVFIGFAAAPALGKPVLRFSAASGQVVAVADYSYTAAATPVPAVDFQFDAGDAARVGKLFAAHVGEQVRISVLEKTVLTPVVREAPRGRGLHLTLNDRASWEELTKILATR